MGKPRTVRSLLQPLGLRDRVRAADGRLHVYRLGHVRVPGLGDIVLGDIVPVGELLYLPTQGRMRYAGLPVPVHQLRVLHVVEVDVGIDELQLVHERILPRRRITRPYPATGSPPPGAGNPPAQPDTRAAFRVLIALDHAGPVHSTVQTHRPSLGVSSRATGVAGRWSPSRPYDRLGV